MALCASLRGVLRALAATVVAVFAVVAHAQAQTTIENVLFAAHIPDVSLHSICEYSVDDTSPDRCPSLNASTRELDLSVKRMQHAKSTYSTADMRVLSACYSESVMVFTRIHDGADQKLRLEIVDAENQKVLFTETRRVIILDQDVAKLTKHMLESCRSASPQVDNTSGAR